MADQMGHQRTDRKLEIVKHKTRVIPRPLSLRKVTSKQGDVRKRYEYHASFALESSTKTITIRVTEKVAKATWVMTEKHPDKSYELLRKRIEDMRVCIDHGKRTYQQSRSSNLVMKLLNGKRTFGYREFNFELVPQK